MIYYKSTRGEGRSYSFSEALLKGIAQDGGLLVSEKIPSFSLKDLGSLVEKSYSEIACFVFNLFKTGLDEEKVKLLINKAYSENFDSPEIAPLVPLRDNQYLLELWHGPTLAFKDMALQALPLFFSEALKKEDYCYLILAATSGDTGKAALEGFKDKERLAINVFYPQKKVSKVQKLQMATQEGENVGVFALDGDFDAIQRAVKEVFSDRAFNEKLLKEFKIKLSSANSINWGRLLPQVVYHMVSYLKLLEQKVIRLGDSVDVAIPTGNFGNMIGALYAKKMGLPIRRFIVASNANNSVAAFLESGIYDVSNKSLTPTPSPAMDILIASNIERLLYLITADCKKVLNWMEQLKKTKRFEVDRETKQALKNEFYSGWVTNQDCLDNIKKVYQETGYLMDPHTSVAQKVASEYRGNLPIIISSTAHWAKFPEAIKKALGKVPNEEVPSSLKLLEKKKVLHKRVSGSKREDLENLILDWLKER